MIDLKIDPEWCRRAAEREAEMGDPEVGAGALARDPEPHPADELLDQVPELVRLIRVQNWKLGGVHRVDDDEAIALIQQAVRTAYSKGVCDGSREMGERLIATANAAISSGEKS